MTYRLDHSKIWRLGRPGASLWAGPSGQGGGEGKRVVGGRSGHSVKICLSILMSKVFLNGYLKCLEMICSAVIINRLLCKKYRRSSLAFVGKYEPYVLPLFGVIMSRS